MSEGACPVPAIGDGGLAVFLEVTHFPPCWALPVGLFLSAKGSSELASTSTPVQLPELENLCLERCVSTLKAGFKNSCSELCDYSQASSHPPGFVQENAQITKV